MMYDLHQTQASVDGAATGASCSGGGVGAGVVDSTNTARAPPCPIIPSVDLMTASGQVNPLLVFKHTHKIITEYELYDLPEFEADAESEEAPQHEAQWPADVALDSDEEFVRCRANAAKSGVLVTSLRLAVAAGELAVGRRSDREQVEGGCFKADHSTCACVCKYSPRRAPDNGPLTSPRISRHVVSGILSTGEDGIVAQRVLLKMVTLQLPEAQCELLDGAGERHEPQWQELLQRFPSAVFQEEMQGYARDRLHPTAPIGWHVDSLPGPVGLLRLSVYLRKQAVPQGHPLRHGIP